MKVSIRDPAAFAALNHRDVRAYLLGQGWQETESLGDRGSALVFTDARGELWEALVPLRQNIGDYARRLAEVVALVARVEQRSELDVLHDLSLAGVDVVRVRVPQAEREGTISARRGVALYEQARDLLLSAACAAVDPRPSYHTGKVAEAAAYFDAVRLGQTERGSYVLTLLSPVDPALKSAQPCLAREFEEEPFPRRVTRTLAGALNRLSAAVTAASLEAFDQSVAEGVSANLCDAVAGLVENGGGADVGITWARTRPVPTPNPRVSFSADDAGLLREAAREFRKRDPRVGVVLTGWVTKLAREPEQFDGKATLQVLFEGERRPRSVQSVFEEADYRTVVAAHLKRYPLSLEGDLFQFGHRWEVRNPRAVRLEPPGEGESPEPDGSIPLGRVRSR